MTAFHVSDSETDTLVRRLAERRSLSITEAINLAVKNELMRDDPPHWAPALPPATMADLERDIRATTLDYSRMLAKDKGKKSPGSRVYQMLRRGSVETLRKLIERPTEGLAFLVSKNRLDLSAERIAADPRYKHLIPEEIRVAAQARLDEISKQKK